VRAGYEAASAMPRCGCSAPRPSGAHREQRFDQRSPLILGTSGMGRVVVSCPEFCPAAGRLHDQLEKTLSVIVRSSRTMNGHRASQQESPDSLEGYGVQKERIYLSLSLFGLAGICALAGWVWWLDLFGKLVLWFGAASFTWKGFQALLGKAGPRRAQATARPASPALPDPVLQAPTNPPSPQGPPGKPSPLSASPDGLSARTDHGEVWAAVKSTTGDTVRGMRRFWVVLALLLLVPITLGLTIGGIVTIFGGDVPTGGVMCAVAGFLVWYCCGPLRRFWKTGEIEVTE
ncbi:hypothetical protein ACFQ08_27620, partial [Streptosporangium algeriense]